MRTGFWCSCWLWLLWLPPLVYSQPSAATRDDAVIIPAIHPQPPLRQVLLSADVFQSIAKGTHKSSGPIQGALIDANLRRHLMTIQDHCKLRDEQIVKMRLAIQGDRQRLIAEYVALEAQYANARLTSNELAAARREIVERFTIPFRYPTHEESLLHKVLHRAATESQWQKFVALQETERRNEIFHSLQETFPHTLSFQQEQLMALASLIAERYPNWHPYRGADPDSSLILLTLAEELQEEIRPLLSATQWVTVEREFVITRRRNAALRPQGALPIGIK